MTHDVAAAQSWDGLVVLCSGTSWDGAALSDRHLATQLARFAPVLFVDPPMSVLTPLRRPELRGAVRAPRLSLLGPNLARLTPFSLPGVSRPVLRDVARRSARRAMRRATGQLGGDVRAVIVGSLDHLFGACGERQRVLWGTDDFSAAGELMGLSPRWLAAQEKDQLARADVVTAVSEPIAQRWRAMGKAVTVIANGCDVDAFARCDDAPLPDDVTLPGPIAGFVGHMSARIDLAYLEAFADTGHSLLLVGPRQATFEINRLEALLTRPNVQWVGPKSFEQLPSYLRVMHAGLTPYARSAFNESSFPLKTLEYLAAGRATVVSDLPAARALDTELVSICASPEEFAQRAAAELEAPLDASQIQARREFAAQHSWAARAADVARLIGVSVDANVDANVDAGVDANVDAGVEPLPTD